MKKLSASLVVLFTMIIAAFSISTVCGWAFYQPCLPKAVKDQE